MQLAGRTLQEQEDHSLPVWGEVSKKVIYRIKKKLFKGINKKTNYLINKK